MKDRKKEKKSGQMSLKEQLAELRKRTKRHPEAMASEEDIKGFNDILQGFKKDFPNEPLLMRITTLGYGATWLDLYMRMSLIFEVLEAMLEEAEEEMIELRRRGNECAEVLKKIRVFLYGEQSQG